MVNYECVRCHYNTKDKRTMRIHLFGRKQCEGIYSNLDLTDEIRDNILTFGSYQEKNMIKNLNNIEDGYIYVLHSRACIDSNRNVFKIGKTKDYEKRIKGYTKGSIYKFVIRVEDYHNTEQKLIKLCREYLIERRDYGCEYFECNLPNIINIIEKNTNILELVINVISASKSKIRIRKSHKPYSCARCNYVTSNKTDMYKHLYTLKKICPATENDIELTDEIKQYILNNRIFKVPKAKKA